MVWETAAMMMITLATAGLLGLIYLGLSGNVSAARQRTKIAFGDGGGRPEAAPLMVAMRMHGNFSEYVPIALILMAGIELAGGRHGLLVILAIILIIARLAHPVGLTRPAPNPFRLVGILGTWLVILVASLWALILAL